WLAALVRPRRSSVVPASFALTLGLVSGEPLSVLYADANWWGVFTAIGEGLGARILVAVAFLFGVVLVLCQWSAEDADVWLPVVRRSLRPACLTGIALGALASTPFFTEWWFLHQTSMIGDLYLASPGLSATTGVPFWSAGPAVEWLEAVYVPV